MEDGEQASPQNSGSWLRWWWRPGGMVGAVQLCLAPFVGAVSSLFVNNPFITMVATALVAAPAVVAIPLHYYKREQHAENQVEKRRQRQWERETNRNIDQMNANLWTVEVGSQTVLLDLATKLVNINANPELKSNLDLLRLNVDSANRTLNEINHRLQSDVAPNVPRRTGKFKGKNKDALDGDGLEES